MEDIEFMHEIIVMICDYAKGHHMPVDDTIRTIAGNLVTLLEISTFENWQSTDCQWK